MSSGFVSGGTTDKPIERDDEWLKAQQDIEANHRRKKEMSHQEGGKTLYDVLQSNKAAKEEAFQESIKLKNQFRNLDEDEIEFLDSVLESTRKKEEDVKKETSEQLDVFRKQQEEANKALLEEGSGVNDPLTEEKAGSPEASEAQWAVNARKRKRAKEKEGLKGVKLRKSSSGVEPPSSAMEHGPQATTPTALNGKRPEEAEMTHKSSPAKTSASSALADQTPGPPTAEGLGLAGYSSDDEE